MIQRIVSHPVIVQFQCATVFSTFDLKSAFHQVPSDNELKQYTAFSAGYHKFDYNILPFRLATSPSIYPRLISNILQDLMSVIVKITLYIYDRFLKD